MSDHEGSFEPLIKMRSNQIENYKKVLKLSEIQKEVLVGTLLGDGCLETQNNGRTFRLKVEHSLQQKEYVDWKYKVFKDWVLTEPKVRKYSAYGLERNNYRFSTVSTGSFRFFAQQFYENGRKVIPKLISKLLTPIALAVWFMDDGSIKSRDHRALVIHSQSFNKIDLERVTKVLEDKYKIKSVLRKRQDGTGHVIYLLSETIDKFIALIGKYVLPSMSYKLGTQLPKR